MATLYRTDGSTTEVAPANGKTFTLAELQGFVGGIIQIVPMPGRRRSFVCHDEGRLIGLPLNPAATARWEEVYGATDELVGDVLIASMVELAGDDVD